ncbi:MAG: DUF6607 family protein [Pseudomonadota bacterium]
MDLKKMGAMISAALVLSGCASIPSETAPAPVAEVASTPEYRYVANSGFASIANGKTATEQDRLAILAMSGDYRVSFDFQETVPLVSDYSDFTEKTSGGYETVVVVSESPTHIVLQHLLVAPSGHVIKHWRQDWTYEASERFEFSSDQTWTVRDLAPEKTAGAWTQCVFEVSDAPRYCGTGRWNHKYGVSTWTSDRTWRPLPRREYTVRSDYNAMNAENRHTITPQGWTHEQDNTKTIRDGEETTGTIVREFGFNHYRNIEGYDFTPANDYWSKTAAFWSLVRDEWQARLSATGTLKLTTDVSGMPIIAAMFGHAEQADTTSSEDQLIAINDVLNTHTHDGSETVAETTDTSVTTGSY